MIVSFKHNYIYFRPKKTGSSTIAEVLRTSLGDDDISGTEWTAKASGQLHVKAADVKALVSPAFWRRAFKFASERHPYEKAVSLAFFRLGKQQQRRDKTQERSLERLPALLGRVVENGEYRGFDYYSIGCQPVVEDFIRHETLESDLRRIAERLAIPVPDTLPRSKSSFRLDTRPAKDILSEEQRCRIYEICRREFELFGYEP